MEKNKIQSEIINYIISSNKTNFLEILTNNKSDIESMINLEILLNHLNVKYIPYINFDSIHDITDDTNHHIIIINDYDQYISDHRFPIRDYVQKSLREQLVYLHRKNDELKKPLKIIFISLNEEDLYSLKESPFIKSIISDD